MKTILLATAAAMLFATTAAAQTATPEGPPIVVLPPAVAGAGPALYRVDDLEDEDVYGADGREIGEIEDVILNADGTVAAVAVEVGGFLGIGDKDVLVRWDSLQISVEGDDLRVSAPALTREVLEAAPAVDLDRLVLGRS